MQCPVCEKPKKNKRRLTCGLKDVAHKEYIKNYSNETRKKTNLIRYGVEYPAQSKEIQNQMKKTTFENYGTEYPAQSVEVVNTMKKTCISRYGTNSYMQSQKSKDDNLLKSGVTHHTKKHISQENLKKLTKKFIEDNFINEDNTCDILKFKNFLNTSTSYIHKLLIKFNISYTHKPGTFKLDEPAILYYIKDIINNYYKIGITNRTIKDRFEKKFKDIKIIEIWHFNLGKEAYDKEQEILKKYSKYHILNESFEEIGGKTEFFSTDILNLDKGN